MDQLNSTRNVHVTYEDHKRLVPLPNDTYEALLDGFLKTFKDVTPASPEQARKMVRFQRYDEEYHDYVDIEPGSSTAGIKKVHARLGKLSTSNPSESYPLVSGKKYSLWALASHKTNGYLRRTSSTTVKADGDGSSTDCQWVATEKKEPTVAYWTFSSPDNKKVLVVENGKVTLKKPEKVQPIADFLPTINGRYQTFQTRLQANQFLGVESDGKVKSLTNDNFQQGSNHNPTPQTLFVPYFL